MPAPQLTAALSVLRDAEQRMKEYAPEATTAKGQAQLNAASQHNRAAIKSLSAALSAELDADAAAP